MRFASVPLVVGAVADGMVFGVVGEPERRGETFGKGEKIFQDFL